MTHDIATIRTDRLVLRPLRPSDADALVQGANKLDVTRWLSVVPFPYTHTDAEAFLASKAIEPRVVWAICDARGVCGVVSIRPELGYWLARDRWGQGYLTEASRAACDAAFADPTRRELTARCMVGNDRSARVLAKLGFRVTGQRMDYFCALQQECATTALTLTRTDWRRLSRSRQPDRARA